VLGDNTDRKSGGGVGGGDGHAVWLVKCFSTTTVVYVHAVDHIATSAKFSLRRNLGKLVGEWQCMTHLLSKQMTKA
jgi:hypothetical protein